MSRRSLTCFLLTGLGLLFCAVPGPAAAAAQVAALAAAPDDADCRPAISAATARHHLPDHLLQAIATTESGRYDFRSGTRVAWPWTVTARGAGHYFATEPDAAAYVRALWADGVTSIDVGCLQINLHYHPSAFGTLEQAFDPRTNADYAAAFLVTLHRPATGWSEAVADYHSADPVEGGVYLQRVMLNLSGPAAPAGLPGLSPALLRALPPVSLLTPVSVRFGITVITPSSVGVVSSRRSLPRIVTP